MIIATIALSVVIAYTIFLAGYHLGHAVGRRTGHLDGYKSGIATAEKVVDELIETNGLQIKRGR